MKKTIVILAIVTAGLVGAANARAGVSFGFHISPPVFVPPVSIYAPPVCVTPPAVVVRPPFVPYGYYGHGHYRPYGYTGYYGRYNHGYYGHQHHGGHGHGYRR